MITTLIVMDSETNVKVVLRRMFWTSYHRSGHCVQSPPLAWLVVKKLNDETTGEKLHFDSDALTDLAEVSIGHGAPKNTHRYRDTKNRSVLCSET